MSNDFSYSGLQGFLNYAAEKGLMNRSSAQGYLVAFSKIQGLLTSEETANVRTLDPDVAFQKLVNTNGNSLSPKSLREYRRRVAQGIDEFTRWRNDPVGYKPKGMGTGKSAKKEPSKKTDTAGDGRKPPQDKHVVQQDLTTVRQVELTIPFPLRENFLAQLTLPRDLTASEAQRLGAFIAALAIP